MPQVRELRKRAANVPDDVLVTLVGDMITEEALPTYMTMLNTLDGVRDETGASQTAWAKWTRQWTAEENRHGDVMVRGWWSRCAMPAAVGDPCWQVLVGRPEEWPAPRFAHSSPTPCRRTSTCT